jgi:hypothetical protein
MFNIRASSFTSILTIFVIIWFFSVCNAITIHYYTLIHSYTSIQSNWRLIFMKTLSGSNRYQGLHNIDKNDWTLSFSKPGKRRNILLHPFSREMAIMGLIPDRNKKR